MQLKKKKDKPSPGQKCLPWDDWHAPIEEILEVTKKFVLVNALESKITSIQFSNSI